MAHPRSACTRSCRSWIFLLWYNVFYIYMYIYIYICLRILVIVDSLQVLNIDNSISLLRSLELIASSLSKEALNIFAKETLEVTVTVIIFIGLSDHVRCFHCGKGLRNWISSDIPWKEHARWYPKCRFVLLTKGQDYINEVCIHLLIVSYFVGYFY